MVSGAEDAIEMRICFWRCTRWLERFATSIQNGFDSFVSTIPFDAVVRFRFSNSGRESTDMSPSASVVTVMKHWLFGEIVRVRARRMSWLFLSSVLSMRRIESGGWDMLIGAINSFRVSKIGAGRQLTSRNIPALGSIDSMCRELKAFPRSTFGGKALKSPNQIRVLMRKTDNTMKSDGVASWAECVDTVECEITTRALIIRCQLSWGLHPNL